MTDLNSLQIMLVITGMVLSFGLPAMFIGWWARWQPALFPVGMIVSSLCLGFFVATLDVVGVIS